MSQSLHPMLNIAIKAARAAGAIINRGSLDLDLLTVTHKGPNDFVSEVDQAAEAVIIETLLTAYPGHGILAEESGRAHGAKNSEYVWIIDPLDGTTNFLHGFPVYCVSIALAWRGVVQQAVVYDPTRNDLFYASRGRGAFLNDRRLRVSKRTRMADGLISTGFPFRRGDNFKRYMAMLELVMQSCAGVRRPGAAALDLCYMAAGWTDGFFETGLSPWDIAAGSLIVTEAGGLIGNFTGEADFLYQREVVAATPKIYGHLVAMLAPFSKAIKADEAGEEAGAGAGVGAEASDQIAAALAASVTDGSDGNADDRAANDDAHTSQPTPERIRKPVRIRRVEAQDALAADAAQGEGEGDEATPKPVPTVSFKPPTPPGAPFERERKPPRLGERKARGPNPDIGQARGPRPEGDRPWGPRPEGDRPRGPRPDGDRPRGPGPDADRPRSARPDGDRPRGPRPEGDRPWGPRPDADRPRGPRPEGGSRGPAKPGARPAFKSRGKPDGGKR